MKITVLTHLYLSRGSTLSGSEGCLSFPGALPPAINFHAFSVKNFLAFTVKNCSCLQREELLPQREELFLPSP
jgi:hypothetical protein